jgi:WD40 repeat protein
MDKTVRIWNNTNPPTLEICEVFTDEAYSVAFHPSGFHIIVGFNDRVRLMNVFQKRLKSFHTISIKGCREIKFSNGGHLFACASQMNIIVYKFFTGETNPEMMYKAHLGPVKSIYWQDDDSGFISGGWDGNVFVWKLFTDPYNPKDQNRVHMYYIKNFQFVSVTNKPEHKSVVYGAANDKTIKMIDHGHLVMNYEAGQMINQIQLLHGGRAIFAGLGENDKPGSIQVINVKFEKIFEVQAHSLPIERLRVSFDNTHLFSAGQDGVFATFSILDKDPQRKDKEYS